MIELAWLNGRWSQWAVPAHEDRTLTLIGGRDLTSQHEVEVTFTRVVLYSLFTAFTDPWFREPSAQELRRIKAGSVSVIGPQPGPIQRSPQPYRQVVVWDAMTPDGPGLCMVGCDEIKVVEGLWPHPSQR